MIVEGTENLTEEQKKILEHQIKNADYSKIEIEESDSAKYFKKNYYVKIANFITPEEASYFYTYIKQATRRLLWAEQNLDEFDMKVFGTFGDVQASGDYSKYGDPAFDSLLEHKLADASYFTGYDLIPTYSYHRLYTNGTELKRHKDRESCEISATLCIGYDVSNVDENVYPDYNWPMFVGPSTGEIGTKGNPIQLKPGDAIFYRGCKLEHWREPYLGKNHAQVFLHYNDNNGKYKRLYDMRPELGLPGSFRTDEQKGPNRFEDK